MHNYGISTSSVQQLIFKPIISDNKKLLNLPH